MRDHDVRRVLHEHLQREHADELSETRFVDELGLCGEVRVDVAVLNGSMAGYELKSASDNLLRLPTQVDVYSRVLDMATLVVAEKHLEHARAVIRPWWGIAVVATASDDLRLNFERRSGQNPSIDAYSLAQLLWRDEALEVLAVLGADRGVKSKPRTVIWGRLVEALALDELRDVVRQRLKRRRGWRSAP